MDSDSYDSDSYFDTHYYVTQLAEAGIPAEQAEALVEAQAYVFEQVVNSTLATKADLESETGELERAINEVRTEMLEAVSDLQDAMRTQAFSIVGSVSAIGVILRIFA